MVALLAGCGATTDTSNSGSSSVSSGSSNMGVLCVPGQQIACACRGGEKGAQKCRTDGAGFEACEGCKSAGSTSGGQSGATSSSAASGSGAGGAASSSASSSGGGGGAPPECTTPTDCGAATVCVSWLCSTGKCVAAPAAEGTLFDQQTPGDCSQLVCDGQGGTKGQYDPTDPQSDGNVCTTDTCSTQGTTHTPQPTGTSCAGGLCNASQTCVAHIPVKCKLKSGGQIYTGCDGAGHPGIQITFLDPQQGACYGLSADVGYCTPGAGCAVSVAGGSRQLGTCQ